MIERIGDATVAYLTDDFRPVPRGEATLIKVVHDDGFVQFVRPERTPEQRAASTARRAATAFASAAGVRP